MVWCRWVVGITLFVGLLAAVAAYGEYWLRQPDPLTGRWVSSAPSPGGPVGSVIVDIEPDGYVRFQVSWLWRRPAWWADGRYNLRRRGERIEVRAGDMTVGKLEILLRAEELLIIDHSWMQHDVFRLQRSDDGG